MFTRAICLCTLLLLAVLVGGSSAELVAHYKLDGNTDDSVGENHGTAFGNPAYGPGIFGQAMKFHGINDYVEIEPFKYTSEQGEFGLTFWFKVRTIPNTATNQGFPYMFNHGMTNRNNNISVYFRAAEFDLRTHTRLMNPANPEDIRGGSGGPVWITDLPAADFVDGEWHMYTITSSAAQGGAIYIDGQVMNTSPTYKGNMVNLVDKLNLGRRGFTGEATRYFGGPDPEDGLIDDVRIYSHALTQEEVWGIMAASTAGGPRPENQAIGLPRDAVLGWTPGESAATHDVYFGTSWADVSAADRTDPRGVLVSQGQVPATYDPEGLLDFGQTYFWRIDEVEPDGTVHAGLVWSFTVERYSYPITAITAAASSSDAEDMGPERTIDSSGLNELDQHSTLAEDMWLSGEEGPQPAWIRYAFDKVYKLHEMWVWNSNQRLESALGVGARNVTVQYSVDGNEWTTLGDFEFAQAPGQATYAPDSPVDFGGAAARYVLLTIESNWNAGGTLTQCGLSEVRFLAVPVSAREPSPADGAADIALAATLSWRAGREARTHEVYLGTDPKALALAATVAEAQYEARLHLGQTYYWSVVEVNEAQEPSAWESDLWSFSTQEYLVVEDFESYNDQENVGTRIYETWIDGWDDPASNGAIVGYADPPFAEQQTVHSGKQSMPLFYDNADAPRSEAQRTFAVAQDWTAHGIGTLSLHFYGDPNNTGQMYVKIDGVKVAYDGGAADIQAQQWRRWDIDLGSVGVNLQAVGTLGIGIDGAAAGVLYIDDIRLYPSRSPAPPSTGPLAAWYEFEGDVNDGSGNGRDGVAHGDPVYAPGRVGQAISFDGIDDYVEVAPFKYTGDSGEFSITLWFKVRDASATATNNGFPYLFNHGMTNRSNNVSVYFRSAEGDLRTHTRLMNPGNPEDVRGTGGPLFILDTTGPDTVDLLDGQWHMYALTSSAQTGGTIYIDGVPVGTNPDYKGDMVNLTDTINVGRRGFVGESTRFFGSPDPDDGLIDNLALWSEALSPESIAQMYADGTH